MGFRDFCRLRQGNRLTGLAVSLSATPVRPSGILHLVEDALLYTVPVRHVVPVELHDIENLKMVEIGQSDTPPETSLEPMGYARPEDSFPVLPA